MGMMSNHFKNLLVECLEKGNINLRVVYRLLCKYAGYLNPVTGNVIAGKHKNVDFTLRKLISIFTGWKAENICVSPNPGGRDAWSAGYWLLNGDVIYLGVIDDDAIAEQMVPEDGVLRPFGGVNIQHGYRTKEDCARAMLLRFLGVAPEDIGVTFGPQIVTEYADGEPLGDQAHPNRSSFFEVLYINEYLLKNVSLGNGVKDFYLMRHATFHEEVAKLNAGQPSMLSRMPEEAKRLAEVFPFSFSEWHMDGAAFSYK